MTISIDTRTPQERAYDELMSGRIYVKPTALPADDDPNDIISILEAVESRGEPEPQPCEVLADGTVIYGDFDGTPGAGYHRAGYVHISTDQWYFSVDGSTISGGSQERDPIFYVEGGTLAQFQQLRDFLNSGALEQMQAAADRWAAGA